MELAGFRAIGEILRSGVYALVWKGKVVYIGKSRKMLGRIYTHKAMVGKSKSMFTTVRGMQFDDVFICPCPVEKLDAVEADMINLYKPRFNIFLKAPGPITHEIVLKHRGMELVINRARPPPIIVERRL